MLTASPWYKQFWPWFLISLPLLTIIACFTFVVISLDSAPSMVVDDYYKKGKAINLELTKFNKAKALYLHGDLTISHDTIKFKFTKGDNKNVSALKISFYHKTLKENDFSTILTKNGIGEFTAIHSHVLLNRYTVFIEPMNGTWKLKESIKLPYNNAFKISPDYK